MSTDQPKRFIDAAAIVRWIETAEGIFLEDLEPGTRVQVETLYSTYVFRLLNAQEGLIEMESDNQHLHDHEHCICRGSTFGGSMIRVHWIMIGMRLEIRRLDGPEGYVTTSPIRTVRISPAPRPKRGPKDRDG
jgi:hypothetical protein